MNSWSYIFPKGLTRTECELLVEYALQVPAHTATVGHGGANVVNEGIRRSTVRWLRRDDEQLYALFARIEAMALKANAEAFGFDLAGFHEIQFTEYNVGQAGHYDWHVDLNWKHAKPFDRKLSMVIQLSPPEAYAGGQLLLENDPLPNNRFVDQGDVLFFPAFNKHKVMPVTCGTRFSLVTWFVGPKFR